MNKFKFFYLIGCLVLSFSNLSAQNSSGLLGSIWNYHHEKAGIGTSYIHLGTCTANKDTLIDGKTFAVIHHSNSNEANEYIRMEGQQALYWFNNNILRLFDFSKMVSDTFEVDLLVNNNTKDTLLGNISVKIDSISYTVNLEKTDSLKTFHYSILSSAISVVFPSVQTPRKASFGITPYLFAAQMSRYSTMRLTELFNPYTNMGMFSKPELTCYTNDSLNISYKHPIYIANNYPCTFTTGVLEANFTQQGATIFPNPTNQFFTVSVNNSSIKLVKLYNITGQLVLEQNLLNTHQSQINIDASSLKTGLYNCVVELANGSTASQRLIKE